MARLQTPVAYVGAAFSNWYNYTGLVAGTVLAIAFREPGWLLLTAGLELAYLYFMATNPRFQRHINSLHGAERELDVESIRAQLWEYVPSEYQRQYSELTALVSRLSAPGVTAAQKRDPYFKDNQSKAAILLANFLRIAVAMGRYAQYAGSAEPQQIEADIKRLITEADQAEPRIQQIKVKNIEILRKRLEKIVRAKANQEYLAAQLEAIEDTLKLVVDQAITLSDPKGIGQQVDNLLQNLQDTDLLSAEMDSYLELTDSADDLLDDVKVKH